MRHLVTPEQQAEIVAAYQSGDKIHDIEARFGVARATIYWILENSKITPNRIQRGRRLVGDDQALAQLYDLIKAQDERIQELEAQLEQRPE